MAWKSMTVRLDADLHDRLRELSEITETSMAELIREALETQISRMAADEARDLRSQLARLHALLESDPDAVERSAEAFVEREASVEDPLEEEAVVFDESEEEAELTEKVRESFDRME